MCEKCIAEARERYRLTGAIPQRNPTWTDHEPRPLTSRQRRSLRRREENERKMREAELVAQEAG